MADIGKIGTAAQKLPALHLRKAILQRGAAGQNLGPLARQPLAQVLHPPQGGDLAQLGRADCDGVQKLFDLQQAAFTGNDCPHAVACQPVGLGKGIKLDQAIIPICSKQIMRRARPCIEIAVGFIDDQSQPMRARHIAKGGQGFGRVFCARGVIGRDQHNRAGARGDGRARIIGRWDHARAHGQGNGPNPLHIQPHFVVEIPWGWQNHLIPRASQAADCGTKGLVAALGDGHLGGRDGPAIGGGKLRGHFGAQGGQAQHGAVQMGIRIVQRGVGNRLAQGHRGQIHRGGLADIDQRAMRGVDHPIQPTARLHHRGGIGV